MGKEVKIGLAVGIFFVLLAGIWFVGSGRNQGEETETPKTAQPSNGGGSSATAGRNETGTGTDNKRVGDAPKDPVAEKRPAVDDKRPGTTDRKVEKTSPFEKVNTKTAVAGAGSRRTHVVKTKETYWSLAVHYYGDPAKAKLIEQANPDIKPANLRVGATLVIPEAGGAAVTPPPLIPVDPVAKVTPKAGEPVSKEPVSKDPVAKAGKPGEYVVQPGDRLQDIVRRKYGDLSRLGEVVAMNKDVLKGNANLLPAGRTIKLPEGERTPITKSDPAKAADPKQPGSTTVVAESPKRFTRID